MKQAGTHKGFHHALKVVDELCIGCTHCMSACPTQAIRIREGKAIIFEERCVDCGNCCKACPVSAIVIEQDDFEEIFNYRVRVALVPSVFIGQFPSRIKATEIFGAMKSLGFTHIVEIDSVVDLVQEGYDMFTQDPLHSKPAISTFCPAVIRLIQVKFPSMVDNLIRVKPPSDIAAIRYRKLLEEQGIDASELGLFYITPCAAKIASVKSPVGEEKSSVNGVINMEYLYNKLLHLIMNNEVGEKAGPDSDYLSSKGILWSMTRGESEHQEGRSLAVDGIRNVTEFLERLEETEDSQIDFLELRGCDESCAGGVLISGNRFLTVERLNKRAASVSAIEIGEKTEKVSRVEETGKGEGKVKVSRIEETGKGEEMEEKENFRRAEEMVETEAGTETFNAALFTLDKIKPRSMLSLDPDRGVALEKMKKRDELLKVLPGIDCAACGSPSCSALAEDIVHGRAETGYCVFLQELYIRDKRLSPEEADEINALIWGRDRNYRSQRK